MDLSHLQTLPPGMRSNIDGSWDAAFIFAQAGLTNHFGYELEADGTITIGYPMAFTDAVLAAIAAYPVAFAEQRKKPEMLDAIGVIRSERIRAFDVSPLSLVLDYETEGRIGRAVQWLEKRPARQFVNWDLGGRNYTKIPRDQMMTLGLAVGDYIQDCFDYSEQLATAVRAAPDIVELGKIDLHAGWPAPVMPDA